MRLTRPALTLVRTVPEAIQDVNAMLKIIRRFGRPSPASQPPDAQPFSISSSQGPQYLHRLSKELAVADIYPRPFITAKNNALVRFAKSIFDPKWALHRSTYLGAQRFIANTDDIVSGSQAAMFKILEAIRQKNLSSLAPMMLDDKVLEGIEAASNISALTQRQLSCLMIKEDDLIGVDGIIDRWKRLDLPDNDPSGLLTNMRIGMSMRYERPILTYSVELFALLRKKILIDKMGSLPAPAEKKLMPTPRAYGLPYMRLLYANIEFGHRASDKTGEFDVEPFLYDFHIHSF